MNENEKVASPYTNFNNNSAKRKKNLKELEKMGEVIKTEAGQNSQIIQDKKSN